MSKAKEQSKQQVQKPEPVLITDFEVVTREHMKLAFENRGHIKLLLPKKFEQAAKQWRATFARLNVYLPVDLMDEGEAAFLVVT